MYFVYSLKILKSSSSSSGLILINLKPSSSSMPFVFVFYGQDLYHYELYYQPLLQVCSHKK